MMHISRIVLALAITVGAATADAATFTVNNAADTTDGTCGAAIGQCTLREAIEDAVATAGRDAIVFDPTVFVRSGGFPTLINLTTPLPVIEDAAGTVIDGAGAGVFLSGGASVFEGLVVASPPGVPLEKVTVANLVVASFTGTAVTICGGFDGATCDADVSGALVQNVAVTNIGRQGIRIEGRVNTKSRIIDSVAFHVASSGISLFGSESLVGGRVERSTARDTGSHGIILSSVGTVTGATVTDSTAVENGENGIAILGTDVAKTKVTNVVTHDNVDAGVLVRATGSHTATKITNADVSENGQGGIDIRGTAASSTVALQEVTAANNGHFGISLGGPTAGAKITDTGVIADGDNGILALDAIGLKLKNVVAARSLNGVFVNAGGGVAERIHASANLDTGIVLLAGSGHTIKKSVIAANGATGMAVSVGATGNVIQKNVALGNGSTDLLDVNPNCDANTWTANVFRTGSQPCIR